MGRICIDEETRNGYFKWGKEQKPNWREEGVRRTMSKISRLERRARGAKYERCWKGEKRFMKSLKNQAEECGLYWVNK